MESLPYDVEMLIYSYDWNLVSQLPLEEQQLILRREFGETFSFEVIPDIMSALVQDDYLYLYYLSPVFHSYLRRQSPSVDEFFLRWIPLVVGLHPDNIHLYQDEVREDLERELRRVLAENQRSRSFLTATINIELSRGRILATGDQVMGIYLTSYLRKTLIDEYLIALLVEYGP